MTGLEKFGVEVAENLGEAAKEAVTNLIGPPTKELGMLFGDVVADWRARNLVSIYQKFLKRSQKLNLPDDALQQLPLGYRALVLEQGSREDRPKLQELWANLLTTSLDVGYSEAHKSYASDIQSLTPLGAQILLAVRNQDGSTNPTQAIEAQLIESTATLVTQQQSDIQASLAILLKLGMLTVFPDKLDTYDVSSLSYEFGDDVGALANAVRILLLDAVERPAFEPTGKYRKLKHGDGEYMWFDMTLSPYGENFFNACIEAQ